jgi:hypothetical protein
LSGEQTYNNDKLSKQGNNQYTDSSICLNQTDAEHPREVVAKVVHKGTATVSKINQIYESDCFNRFLSFFTNHKEAQISPRVRGMTSKGQDVPLIFLNFPPRAWNDCYFIY